MNFIISLIVVFVCNKMNLHLPSSSITFISISSKDSILDGLKGADLPNWKEK